MRIKLIMPPTFDCGKAELANIDRKIANGMKAIIGGMDFPELEDEITKLRTWKGELQDIISARQSNIDTIDPKEIAQIFRQSATDMKGNNAQAAIKRHITKIYAHPDTSYEVEIGVLFNGECE